MAELYGKIELICTAVMLQMYILDVHSLNLKCIISNSDYWGTQFPFILQRISWDSTIK
jgi:hypothetical protein